MQWKTILARGRAREEAKRKAFEVALTASVKDQMTLLNERDSPEEVKRWLERCTDVGSEKAVEVAPHLYQILRDLSGETHRECERERAERVKRGARR